MAKASKRRIRAIAIFVIFAALAWAGATTMKQTHKPPNLNQIFQAQNQQFNSLPALNTAKISVHSRSMGNAVKEVQNIISTYGLKTHTRSYTEGYGAYIFQVQNSNYTKVVEKLSKVGSIVTQDEIVDTLLGKKNLATEEAILESKRKDRNLLDSAERAYGNVTKEKTDLEEAIKDLENNVVTPLRQSNTVLVYIQLVPAIKSSSTISSVVAFVKSFAIALVVLFIASILAYYGTKLIMYLLSLLGVKGFGMSNAGGGYNYGYGNYANRYYSRYGYGGSKRKVKRIYKRKPGSPSDEETPEDEEHTKE
jgi:hypothetical protein